MVSLDDEGYINSNLQSWNVTKVDKTGIEVKLTFERPIDVSQALEPDMLVLAMRLGNLKDFAG